MYKNSKSLQSERRVDQYLTIEKAFTQNFGKVLHEHAELED